MGKTPLWVGELARPHARKVSKIGSHSGRHFFKSYLTGKVGADLVELVLGHSQGSVADAYLVEKFVENTEPVRQAIEKLYLRADDHEAVSLEDVWKQGYKNRI